MAFRDKRVSLRLDTDLAVAIDTFCDDYNHRNRKGIAYGTARPMSKSRAVREALRDAFDRPLLRPRKHSEA